MLKLHGWHPLEPYEALSSRPVCLLSSSASFYVTTLCGLCSNQVCSQCLWQDVKF